MTATPAVLVGARRRGSSRRLERLEPTVTIYVCSLEAFPALAAEVGPSHVVSMLGDDAFPARPHGVPPENHLCLRFHDIIAPVPGQMPPEAEHMERLLAFAETWDGVRPLISHCFAGVSRSSAAAFTLLCMRHPGKEPRVARLLRDKAAYFQPNRLMVELADQLLGKRGRLLSALEEMGLPDPLAPRGCIAIPVDLA